MASQPFDTIFYLGEDGNMKQHDITWVPTAGDWPELEYLADEPPEFLPMGDDRNGNVHYTISMK
jgi:hypothetical protein